MELKSRKYRPHTILGCLLIVPYGIEMLPCVRAVFRGILLIVPYGIEIYQEYALIARTIQTFNRTLWN